MSATAGAISAAEIPQLAPVQHSNHLASFCTVAEKLLDFIAVLAGVYVADALYQFLKPQQAARYAVAAVYFWAAAFALLFVFLLERHGGYRPSVSLLGIRETERILRVTLQGLLFALLAAYFIAVPIPRLVFCLAATTVPLFLTIEKWEMHRIVRAARSKGYGSRRAVILGAGPEARRVYSALVRSPKFGVDPVAFVDDDPQRGATEIYEPSYHPRHSAGVISGPLCPELFHRLQASVLVIATPALARESLLLTIAKASEAGVSTYFAPGDLFGIGGFVEYSELDGVLVAHHPQDASRTVYKIGKRVLDLAAAGIGLVVLALLAPLVAIAIKLTSPGPVLFRQERVGETGRRFTMYKFRTMYRDAPVYSYSPGAGDDPRVTRVGRLLRHLSIDELPQLINVLTGEMSLVGPRPEMPFIVEQYTPVQRLRLSVKPGITGLWQISPARAFPITENLDYDFYYVRHRSLFMDLAILLHTVLFAARGI